MNAMPKLPTRSQHGRVTTVEARYPGHTEISIYRPQVIPGAGKVFWGVISHMNGNRRWWTYGNGFNRYSSRSKREAIKRAVMYCERDIDRMEA
jgi:hypothetical protein